MLHPDSSRKLTKTGNIGNSMDCYGQSDKKRSFDSTFLSFVDLFIVVRALYFALSKIFVRYQIRKI